MFGISKNVAFAIFGVAALIAGVIANICTTNYFRSKNIQEEIDKAQAATIKRVKEKAAKRQEMINEKKEEIRQKVKEQLKDKGYEVMFDNDNIVVDNGVVKGSVNIEDVLNQI